MNDTKIAQWSRWLIYFIIATLPLERIPALSINSLNHVNVRLDQAAGLFLITLNLPWLWRRRNQLLEPPLRWLALFLIACLCATGLALDLTRGLFITGYTIFVSLLAWVIAVRFEPEKQKTYLKILFISATAVCLFGLYQFFGDLIGLPLWVTGLRVEYTKILFGFPRIQSTALEPLFFANYLLIPLSLNIALLIYAKSRRWFLWALVNLLLFMTVIWLTLARGAYVAVAAIILISLVVAGLRRMWKRAAGLALVTVFSVGLAVGLVALGTFINTSRVGHKSAGKSIETFSKHSTDVTTGESAEGRTLTRKLAINAFRSHPILGIGPGNFGGFANSKNPARFGKATVVDNEPLEILAETGLIGLLLFGLFGADVTLLITKVRWKKLGSVGQIFLCGTILSLIGIAIQYQTFSTLYITYIWVTIGLLIGLIKSSQQKTESLPKQQQ